MRLNFTPPPVARPAGGRGLDIKLAAQVDDQERQLRRAELGNGWVAFLAEHRVTVRVLCDPVDVRAFVDELATVDQAIAFDLETAVAANMRFAFGPKVGLDPLLARARLAQFYAGGDEAVVVDLDAVGGLEALRPALEGCRLVAFNATFEAKLLLAAGIEPGGLEDAALAAGLVLGGGKRVGSLVDAVRAVVPGMEPPATKRTLQQSDFDGELSSEQIAYAASDAVMTLALWETADVIKHRERARRVYDAARNVIVPTARMELAGMPFDRTAHAAIAALWARLAEQEKARFVQAYGIRPGQNIEISKRLLEQLRASELEPWPRTPTGRLSLRRKDIDVPGRNGIALVADRLRYTQVATLSATFGAALGTRIHPLTGRLHGGFRIAYARGGRFSCAEPNHQQAPKGAFRRVYRAPPGRKIVSADYSAVELRAAALEAQERTLLDVFGNAPKLTDGSRNPAGDPHAATALAFGLDPNDDQDIVLAKALNFGTLYGMGASGFSVYARVSLDEAERLLQQWREVRPAFARWQAQAKFKAKRRRYAQTPCGRRVPVFVVQQKTGAPEFHANLSLNTPIQGGCAEAMLVAIATLDRRISDDALDALPVCCVHDELVVEAADADVERVRVVLEESMRAGFEAVYRDYPGYEEAARFLVSGVKAAQTWGGEPLDPAHLPESLAKDLTLIEQTAGVDDEEEEVVEFGEVEDLETDLP